MFTSASQYPAVQAVALVQEAVEEVAVVLEAQAVVVEVVALVVGVEVVEVQEALEAVVVLVVQVVEEVVHHQHHQQQAQHHPPTSPTTTFTSGTPVATPTTTTINLGCAGDGSNVQVGQAGVFECWYAWNGFTPVSITATQGVQENVASEVATFYYMKGSSQQYPDALVGGPWQASGHCPYGWTATVAMSGGSFNQPLNGYGTAGVYTWWVTVSAYCVSTGHGALFAFFSTWNPPELPLTWLLRGGSNVESVIAPLYLRAWNEYVSAWLAENGFALDLLILLALIMPILAKPASRRIRLT